jgi:predicted DNA-binding protein (MmcQ/YjbR family)
MIRAGYREYCLAKKGVTEEFPSDGATAVHKVGGKIFTLADAGFKRINVKCRPDEAIVLREKYPSVIPGYHMNKRHWNSVIMDGSIKDELIYRWIDKAYNLVVAGLTEKKRQELGT